MLKDVASGEYLDRCPIGLLAASINLEHVDTFRRCSSDGQDEEVVKMVARMNELKKQGPGTKEKDAEKDTQLQQ